MSVSGISSANPYANIFFDTTQQRSNLSSMGQKSSSDTVHFSPEAMELLQASKAEQQLVAGAEAQEENATFLEQSGHESLAGMAISGGMRVGGGAKPNDADTDEEDDESSQWYDELFETTYGENALSTSAEEIFNSTLSVASQEENT